MAGPADGCVKMRHPAVLCGFFAALAGFSAWPEGTPFGSNRGPYAATLRLDPWRNVAPAPWWMAAGFAPLAAWSAVGAASEAGARVNLANPGTLDLEVVGTAPTWDSAGWTGFSTTKAFSTGTAGGRGYTYIVRYDSMTGSGIRFVMGATQTSSTGVTRLSSSSTGLRAYANWSDVAIVTGAITNAGVLAVAGTLAYLNGVDEGVSLNVGTALSRPIYIGAANAAGATAYPCQCRVRSAIVFNTTLTSAQVAAASAAMP